MASKRRIRRQACTGKTCYATPQAAHAAARWRRRETGQEIGYYHCRWCNQWHIGHTPASVLRARRLSQEAKGG